MGEARGRRLLSIPEQLASMSRFRSLLHLLRRAELLDELAGPGERTLFAPTDDAFAQLPLDVLDTILGSSELLLDIAEVHVLSGARTADELARSVRVVTVQGSPLSFTRRGNEVRVEGQPILRTDVRCRGGMIHAIGMLLAPQYGKGVRATAVDRVQRYARDLANASGAEE